MNTQRNELNGKAVHRGEIVSHLGPQSVVEQTNHELTEANAQLRKLVQQETEALKLTLEGIVSMTAGTSFRVRIEEEINVIERPSNPPGE